MQNKWRKSPIEYCNISPETNITEGKNKGRGNQMKSHNNLQQSPIHKSMHQNPQKN